jgi:hypothetical protein
MVQRTVGHVHVARELRPCRAPAEHLRERVRLAAHLVQRGHLAERHAREVRLLPDRLKDGLANPPHRVRYELAPLGLVEPRRRAEQSEVALAHQVREQDAAVLVPLRHRHHEAEVRAHERVEGLGVAGARACGEGAFLIPREHRETADALEIRRERIGRSRAMVRHASLLAGSSSTGSVHWNR